MANFDDVLVILLADVAANYVQFRTFEERLRFTYENIRIQEGSLKIVEDRNRFGAVTERDVQQARTVLDFFSENLLPFTIRDRIWIVR